MVEKKAPKSAADHVSSSASEMGLVPAADETVEKPKRGRKKAEQVQDATPAAESKKSRGRKKSHDRDDSGGETGEPVRAAGGSSAAGASAFSLMFQAPPTPTPVIGANGVRRRPDGDAGDAGGGSSTSTRRTRSRRRSGEAPREGDEAPNTVVRVRQPRQAPAPITEPQRIRGSTRLEAKKQRRRDGRDAGRRRPVITEAEFLARRESVDRVMVVRSKFGRIQIAVLEDGVLVEHYVARAADASLIGNVYLGRVQNVLPSHGGRVRRHRSRPQRRAVRRRGRLGGRCGCRRG